MGPFSFSLAVVSGICFATGVFHLFIGLRRRGTDMRHFTFGLFAVAYGGAVLTGLLMYGAGNLPQYLAVDRWSGVFAGMTYVFLIWFVAVCTDVQPLAVVGALTAAFAILVTAHLTRATLIHGEIMGITSITLPWGEKIAFLDAAESTWELVFILTQLVTIGFLFYACIRQYRRGDRGAALALGAGLLFFAATIVFDMFVESGVIDFVLASDFGFLPLALVMSLRLSNDVIRTEEKLVNYRQTLETMVGERTAELQEANLQLESEIGERRMAEGALQQRVKELAVLGRITRMLAMVADLPSALEQVCEEVCQLFDAQHAYVVMPSGEEPGLQVLVGFQDESGPVGATLLPVMLGETRYFDQVLSKAESLIVTQVQTLPLADPMSEFVKSQGLQNAMLIPLVVRGSPIGLLAVATDRAGSAFSPDQVHLADTVAGEVASAIENARLSEKAQEAAVAEERSRLARDLHDEVTQTVYSATLIAEALPRVWERSPEEGQRNLVKLRQLVRGALAEMRTLLFELRPAALEAADLDSLLRYLSDALTGRTRIPVEIVTDDATGGETELPADVTVALYRIAQEAFNNITKHASATRVGVSLKQGPDELALSIEDNGRGFDPDSVSGEKMGLHIMHERAEKIGAEWRINSAPGQGTEVIVVWTDEAKRNG